MDCLIRQFVSIDDSQFGFVPSRGTTDAVFVVRQLREYLAANSYKLCWPGNETYSWPPCGYHSVCECPTEWSSDGVKDLFFSPLWFEPSSGHMWESQVLLTDGQVVFLRVLRFSPTFDERSARHK